MQVIALLLVYSVEKHATKKGVCVSNKHIRTWAGHFMRSYDPFDVGHMLKERIVLNLFELGMHAVIHILFLSKILLL